MATALGTSKIASPWYTNAYITPSWNRLCPTIDFTICTHVADGQASTQQSYVNLGAFRGALQESHKTTGGRNEELGPVQIILNIPSEAIAEEVLVMGCVSQ